MGVAALVLGIVSVIIALIPFCGSIAFVPAVIGLILGIVDTVQKNKNGEKKGMSIAGIVLNAIAIVFIAFYVFVISVGVKVTFDAVNSIYPNEINSIFSNIITELE